MARFLGNASGRTLGVPTGAAGFTKAKIFSGPGTTTFTVPQDVTKLKVFVVGAGSSYRSGTYAFCGSSCCSGVSYPVSCYCACFTGHLTGAGGGYAEKTFLQTSDRIAGKTLTINVGSIGGLSASSVSGTGISTVTASNATEASYSWACTNNSTARDNSNDNPISIGIELPVCGYVNCFSGYYNKGGTASGGDINRTGGKGILIPEFICDSYFDGITGTFCTTGTSTNSSSCWINPTFYCGCGVQYHYQFGWSNAYLLGDGCAGLCANINNLCYGTGSGAQCVSSRYAFLGNATKTSYGSENIISDRQNNASNKFIKNVPIGVGAQSGNSTNDGNNGHSELTLTDATNLSTSSSGGSGSINRFSTYYIAYGYDFSFGGQRCTVVCMDYTPGVYSVGSCPAIGSNSSFCYVTREPSHWSGWTGGAYYYCWCLPYGLASSTGGSGYCCTNRTYNLGFINDPSSETPKNGYTINLSSLVDENNMNITDVLYGRGAGISTAASFGGGGNRLYPNGGSGLVVVIY